MATIVFFLGRLTGNPVDMILPEDATGEDRAALIKTLGLDGPLHEQYLIFVGHALQGDLGTSIRYRQPAVEAFFSRLPNTLAVIPWALLLAMAVGIPLGVQSTPQVEKRRHRFRPGGHGFAQRGHRLRGPARFDQHRPEIVQSIRVVRAERQRFPAQPLGIRVPARHAASVPGVVEKLRVVGGVGERLSEVLQPFLNDPALDQHDAQNIRGLHVGRVRREHASA